MPSLNRSCQSIQLIGLFILAGIEWANPQLALSHPSQTNVSEPSTQENVRGLEAEDENPNSLIVQTFEFQPPDRGAPGNRSDAGSRGGDCSQLKKPMTALIPTTNWGETIAAHPTFWLYLPSQAAAIEFILKDEAGQKELYKVDFPVTQGPGIVSFRLPDTAPPLQEGKAYRWMFNFTCASESNGNSTNVDVQNPSVSGIVARITPSAQLTQQLEKASLSDKIVLYAQNGLWYEMLTQLAELRRTQPDNRDVTAQWISLLEHEAVRLNNITQEPILTCCQVDQVNSLYFPVKQTGSKGEMGR
ncbi:hypothetical protein M595_2401 [Lyngbya aestuarii BL J]|uniref:DUF928 domain-containing protein n=1 Tax=Lyngbya aestuarii BL J TaxID=1348334 RepID=U7QMQ9_9CYAN|nr:DUF928 domain-containing protein [Lyngbya aestuarii]ERT07696.1 hypothetical protein M595_2401 [Lyngbya aestuarii BL J]